MNNQEDQLIYLIRIVDNNSNAQYKEFITNLSNPISHMDCSISKFWDDIVNNFLKSTEVHHMSFSESVNYLKRVNIEFWIGESKNSTERNLINLIYKLFEFGGLELMNDLVPDDFDHISNFQFILTNFFKKTPSKLSDNNTYKYSFVF